MIENASQFAVLSIIFPFILILLLAGIVVLVSVGLVLFISGLKSKWSELNNAKRVAKIISIALGAILLVAALLITSWITMGFIVLIQNGGFFGNRNEPGAKPEQEAVLLVRYLLAKIK